MARQLFTIDDYHRMGETGILSAEDRLELLVPIAPVPTREASRGR